MYKQNSNTHLQGELTCKTENRSQWKDKYCCSE